MPGFKAASWDKGYGDFVVKPDLGALRRVPTAPGTALVLGDVADHDGQELPISPRTMLKRQLARLAERGLTAKMASVQFVDDSYAQARQGLCAGSRPAGLSTSRTTVFETTSATLMRAIRNGMEAAGVPVQESKGEWGPGQEKLNLVARRWKWPTCAFHKNGVKSRISRGPGIGFMAKWRPVLAGNSCHIHGSLWHAADGRPALHRRAWRDAHPPVPGRLLAHAAT
ncbi:MAG: hypothetical protein U1E17_09120 [Geminicoccaceae bacterium]